MTRVCFVCSLRACGCSLLSSCACLLARVSSLCSCHVSRVLCHVSCLVSGTRPSRNHMSTCILDCAVVCSLPPSVPLWCVLSMSSGVTVLCCVMCLASVVCVVTRSQSDSHTETRHARMPIHGACAHVNPVSWVTNTAHLVPCRIPTRSTDRTHTLHTHGTRVSRVTSSHSSPVGTV